MISPLEKMSLIDIKYVEAAKYPVGSNQKKDHNHLLSELLSSVAIITIICGIVFGIAKITGSKNYKQSSNSSNVTNDLVINETTTAVIDDVISVNRFEIKSAPVSDIFDSGLCILINEINLSELIDYYELPIDTEIISNTLSKYFSETTYYSGNNQFMITTEASKPYDTGGNSLYFYNSTKTITINLWKRNYKGTFGYLSYKLTDMEPSFLNDTPCYLYEQIDLRLHINHDYYSTIIIGDTAVTISGTNFTLDELVEVTKLIMKTIQ